MSEGCVRLGLSAIGPAVEMCEHGIGLGYCKQCSDARIAKLEAEVAQKEDVSFFAFVAGAKWWEHEKTGATMWPVDVRKAEKVAKERYPYAPHPLVVEANAQRDAALREVARLEALILQVEIHSVNPLLEDEAERIRSRKQKGASQC